MKLRIGLLVTLVFVSFALAQGCVIQEVATDDDDNKPTTTAPQSRLPGQTCGCDAECAGDGAICLLGMCAKRAAGFCPEPGTELGCEPGFTCFNTDILLDGGVCFPAFDPATCEGAPTRANVCSPIRGWACDPACGVACIADTTLPGGAGAACLGDVDCNFHPDGACYADDGVSEPSGWVEGYCLAFGCTADVECGDVDKGCMPAASDGAGVCMNRCGMDLDCRAGYVCATIDDANEVPVGKACFAGCDAAATCPGGFTCLGDICVDESTACSVDNPTGWCPDGSWCDNGICNDQAFGCGDDDDPLEPNDSLGGAVAAPRGVTHGLRSCQNNEDWYRITVPAGKIVRVGIEFQHDAGDLDMVAYDANGALLGSRYGKAYPYSYRDQETNTEYYGFYSQTGAEYHVRVVGYASATVPAAENVYSLHVDQYDYVDGESCTASGFTFDECAGHGASGSGLLPFPFADPNDSVVGSTYMFDTFSNYRFARRELIMLVRNALRETSIAFPGTNPLGLIDICQKNGITPGYDVGSPRHPETTHDQGGNIDIAYFQTDGNNSAEIICGDGSQHADGFCSSAATTSHKVDLPRQAFFMAQLYASTRTRVIGVDQVIGPLIKDAATTLNQLPASDPQHITSSQLSAFNSGMAYGSGWPYHHHHIHLSLQWWTGQSQSSASQSTDTGGEQSLFAPHGPPDVDQHVHSWPPRPAL